MTIPGCGYAAALRRVVKRREALATAQPFIVATIGFADAYLYCKGVLCYSLDLKVRILDLHHCGGDETVISVPELLTLALPNTSDSTRGLFRVLYYSDDIVSCIYTSSTCENQAGWLIAFSIKARRILVTKGLDSTCKIFVRHNREFLYYGTHSEIDTDGYRKWVIHGYDFTNMKWFDRKMHLSDMVGSEIGSTICFELHKGYFYALSSQTSFEVEEIDWSSFYHCVRFPLEFPYSDLLEKTENMSMWRRQHQEGPIHDRWTSLRLYADENTDELKVMECRREWRQGSSRSRRTCYTTDITFPCRTEEEDLYYWDPASSQPSSLVDSIITAPSSPKIHPRNLSSFPDEPILRLLGPDDNPHHMQPPSRLPQYIHPESDSSSQSSFTLTDSPLRYYDTSSSTFLDLVNDPHPDAQNTQRVRLRAIARKHAPPLLHPPSHYKQKGMSREPSSDLSIALKEIYVDQPIQYWPPVHDPLHPDGEDVDAWYRLLNPPTHLGNVEGTSNERSLVYVTGGYEKPQAIVFVGFDPAMRMVGLKRWGGIKKSMCQKRVGIGSHNVRTARSGSPEGELQALSPDVDEADRTMGIKRAGNDEEKTNHGQAVLISSSDALDDADEITGYSKDDVPEACSWIWQEKAMYRDIGLGFYFGLERGTEI